jgi:cullin-associated NEDD8-dissociated protein 1
MMRDSDVENRRTALSTFAAAVRNKLHLLLPHINAVLPLVLDQARKDPSLIREVSMGPFKHTVDDGLEVRKNAYETLYSLMEIAPGRILQDEVSRSSLFERAIAGVNDDRSIQSLSNLMLPKLASAAPEEMLRRLDLLAEQLRIVLAFKPKDTAVRPEVEKAEEAKRGVVKVTLELGKMFPSVTVNAADAKNGTHTATGAGGALRPVWSGYWEWLMVNYGELVKAADRESKESGRAM